MQCSGSFACMDITGLRSEALSHGQMALQALVLGNGQLGCTRLGIFLLLDFGCDSRQMKYVPSRNRSVSTCLGSLQQVHNLMGN